MMNDQSKNAAYFGFSPDNNGDANTLALQHAVTGGGTIYIDQVGIYDLSGTIVLDSCTKLVFGPGVILRKVPAQDGTPLWLYFCQSRCVHPLLRSSHRDNRPASALQWK